MKIEPGMVVRLTTGQMVSVIQVNERQAEALSLGARKRVFWIGLDEIVSIEEVPA